MAKLRLGLLWQRIVRLTREHLAVKGPAETRHVDLKSTWERTVGTLFSSKLTNFSVVIEYSSLCSRCSLKVNMIRNGGGVASNNVRPIYGLGLLLLILLWVWKLNSPSPAASSSLTTITTLETSGVQPRLNTSWHNQIAKEQLTDKTGLKGVETPSGVLDRTRVALLIENRPLPYLIPLLLHFISVVPPEWSFRFMGSEESIALMESNPVIRQYMDRKKLFIDLIPYNIVPSVDVSTIIHLFFLLDLPRRGLIRTLSLYGQ